MALNADQMEKLETLLQGLEPEIKNLNPSSQSFVRDQIKRFDQYGDRMFISPKQWAWLEDLYKKNVGDPPGADERPDDDDQEDGDVDMDDEVPF
jgi:hypothetical protein